MDSGFRFLPPARRKPWVVRHTGRCAIGKVWLRHRLVLFLFSFPLLRRERTGKLQDGKVLKSRRGPGFAWASGKSTKNAKQRKKGNNPQRAEFSTSSPGRATEKTCGQDFLGYRRPKASRPKGSTGRRWPHWDVSLADLQWCKARQNSCLVTNNGQLAFLLTII